MPRSEFIFEVCKDDHLYGTLPGKKIGNEFKFIHYLINLSLC